MAQYPAQLPSERLDPDQLAELKKRLLECRSVLAARRERRIRARNALLVQHVQGEPDSLEIAQLTTIQDDWLFLNETEREQLSAIEQALSKLDSGAYGVDEATGEPIAYDRLLERPWTRHAEDLRDPEPEMEEMSAQG